MDPQLLAQLLAAAMGQGSGPAPEQGAQIALRIRPLPCPTCGNRGSDCWKFTDGVQIDAVSRNPDYDRMTCQCDYCNDAARPENESDSHKAERLLHCEGLYHTYATRRLYVDAQRQSSDDKGPHRIRCRVMEGTDGFPVTVMECGWQVVEHLDEA